MAGDAWDSLDPQDLARLRDRRLRHQVRFQLYAFSAHYRRVFEQINLQADGFRGVDDLPRLPLVDRAGLAAAPDDFLLRASSERIQRWGSPRQLAGVFLDKMLRGIEISDKQLRHEYEPVHRLETSGATGDPVPVRLSRRDLSILATQGRRMLEVAGVREGGRVLNLLEPLSSGGFWPVWLGGVALGVEQIAPGFLEPKEAAALAATMEASTVVARAEDALALLETAGGLPRMMTLILGPEPTSPDLSARLRGLVSSEVRILSTYGFAEGRTVWAECAEGSGQQGAGYHTSPDLELFELISPRTLRPMRAGEPGEIVFTGLDQRGTALARYRPGDVALGGISTAPCPWCGRTVERVIGPIVRATNLLEVQPAGDEPVAIDVGAVSEALAHPDLAAWRVEVTKTDGDPRGADEVYVLFKPRRGDPARLAVELNDAIASELRLEVTQFVLSETAGGGVVDLRPAHVAEGEEAPDASGET